MGCYISHRYYSNRKITITPREILVCLIAAAISVSAFFVFNSSFIAKDHDKISMMNRATIISSIDKFIHGMNTDIGHVFSVFELEGPTDRKYSTAFPEIKNQYLAVRKIREEWTMHTVTTTDSKGHIQVHTYYSWDYAGTTTDVPEKVIFNGIEIPYSVLDNQNWKKLHISHGTIAEVNNLRIRGEYVKKRFDSDTRWYYEVLPLKISGSFFGFVDKNFPSETVKIYEGYEPEDLSIKLIEDVKSNNFYRWLIFTVIVLVLAIVFCIRDNDWLNRSK